MASLINDFADQLLEESTALANYELKERIHEEASVRRLSELYDDRRSTDAMSVNEGASVRT